MTIVVAHPPGYGPERAYAARVVLDEFLGLACAPVEEERTDVELRLDGRSLRVADVLFATPAADWLTPPSLPREPLARAGDLPVLYGREPFDGLGVDVFGSSFFLLTRYEELVVAERDARGRFPAHASLAARERFLDRPLVNEYVELLWARMRETWPSLERRPRSFRLLPSHDVDWPRYRPAAAASLRGAARDLVRERNPRLAVRRLAGRDLYATFDELMELSERLGVASAFYFIAGHGGGPAEVEADYSIDDPSLAPLLRRIHERGHEIGLHPSYETWRDAERTAAELRALRRVCGALGIERETWGGRQHFLRWENPTTWEVYEQAGLAYDSSVGFAEEAGFRCGVCFDYPVFDLRARRELALRERPLVVMEAAFLHYQRARPEEASARIAALRETCRRFGGDFTLLWHNSRLVTQTERRLYRAALGL